MACELESVSRALTKAKSMQFSGETSESGVGQEINSICSQLEQVSTLLKGANFNGIQKNDVKKKNGNGHFQKSKQDTRQGLKGPGISAAGPFKPGKNLQPNAICSGCGQFLQTRLGSPVSINQRGIFMVPSVASRYCRIQFLMGYLTLPHQKVEALASCTPKANACLSNSVKWNESSGRCPGAI